MSKKGKSIIPVIAVIFIIVSVIFNIYQFNSNDALKSEVAALQSNIQTLETERDTLGKEIESKKTEESDLSKQIENLQKKIEQLEADNRSLLDSLKDLEERQKVEVAVKDNTSEIAESDTKVQESKPSSNGNGGGSNGGNGGGSTTPSGSDGEKLRNALKQLGVDTSQDASEAWKNATPAPDWGSGDYSSGKGIEAY